jgi:cellulose synthase/poly-beta-1,6-N-acetylglucosamine synthase-like glycosyltransferase
MTVVTFISSNETINSKLFPLLNELQSSFDVEMIIYANNAIDISLQDYVKVIICPDTTKYKRILQSFDDARSTCILFIDNDITPDIHNLTVFVDNISSNPDLAWGYIGVSETLGFFSKLITVDKLLSHKIIRPFLWKLNIGISVPGQVFLVNKTKFQADLPQYDTVFDDLTIGICAKKNSYRIKQVPLYLGYENPSLSLHALIKQRIRWAKGFSQSIFNNFDDKKMLPFIFIHGIAYHLLCFVFWGLFCLLYKLNLLFSVLLWIFTCIIVSDRNFKIIVYVGIYTIIFPFVHLIWVASLIYNSINLAVKGKRIKGG